MLTDLIFATITPSRRAPVVVFAAVQFLIAAAIFIVYNRLQLSEQGIDGAPQSAVLLLVWCNFCILANRFHDAGQSSVWLLPPFMIGVFAFLADLDPAMLGTDWATQDAWAARILVIRNTLGLLACIVFGLALKFPSDEGRNLHGLPFGEREHKEEKNLQRDVSSVRIKKIGQGHWEENQPIVQRPPPPKTPAGFGRANSRMPSPDRLRRAGVVR